MPLLPTIRDIAKRLLGEETLGTLDYFRFPARRDSWGGPFNGQHGRQAIFNGIIANARPVAIVETGTYLGTTTEFMASAGLPIFTIEGQPRNFGYSKTRLRGRRNVSIFLGDSRSHLRLLLAEQFKGRLSETVLFYLDAHWYDDLPLAEEIEIIYSSMPSAVCLIDDFAVPGDMGYAFDDYGAGKVLDAGYIAPLLEQFGLTAYYPVLPSTEESGMKRGCVAIAKPAIHGPALLAAGLRLADTTQ
jgi:hypothetical protein